MMLWISTDGAQVLRTGRSLSIGELLSYLFLSGCVYAGVFDIFAVLKACPLVYVSALDLTLESMSLKSWEDVLGIDKSLLTSSFGRKNVEGSRIIG
jgi:hypothetical protein